jgi:predicted DNA-binding transcriptional regulator YafY
VKTGLSPTGRALRVLELLQAQPGITGAQLAAQLKVTERAARRYIAILREAGIPVESTRGPYGGYRAGRGLRLPPLVFTATEALGLVMAVLDGSHAAADADDPVGAALGKIIRALPVGGSSPSRSVVHTQAGRANYPDSGAASHDVPPPRAAGWTGVTDLRGEILGWP